MTLTAKRVGCFYLGLALQLFSYVTYKYGDTRLAGIVAGVTFLMAVVAIHQAGVFAGRAGSLTRNN